MLNKKDNYCKSIGISIEEKMALIVKITGISAEDEMALIVKKESRYWLSNREKRFLL